MLEPTTPQEAVTEYLNDISAELAATTIANHEYRLKQFLDWTNEAGINNMNNITGRKLQEFKQWKQGEVAKVTLKNHLSTLRQFIEFCEDTNAVPTGVGRKIRLPTMQLGEDVNDTFLTAKEADRILDYCDTYEYATLRHTAFYILWHTGMRSGALRGLDMPTSTAITDSSQLDTGQKPTRRSKTKNEQRVTS
jgi:site-specific recombinase XerD